MTDKNIAVPDWHTDPYLRIIDFFDMDATAGSFLAEDGEGGFAGAIHRMAREIDRLRSAHPPHEQLVGEPEYCFDPNNWEFTCNWADRDEVHRHGDALSRSEPMRVATLIKGPDKWVADVPVTWDEHGDPDETEVKWFDSEQDARAALTTEGQP